MSKGVLKAVENHKDKKYNCAQAVLCAYSDELGMEEELLYKIGEGMGLGMGNMEGTCGAVAGAVLVASMKNSDGSLGSVTTRKSTYDLSKGIVEKFIAQNGSIVCKTLKGRDTKKVLRSCHDCVKDAATFLEEMIIKE